MVDAMVDAMVEEPPPTVGNVWPKNAVYPPLKPYRASHAPPTVAVAAG